MAAPTVFDTALELLDGRFTNNPLDSKGKGENTKHLTAYAAVKLAYGVERDDHAIAYNGSNWPALHDTLMSTFAALDEVTAESDERPVPFSLWCSRPRRTHAEVEAVLREAARRHPEMVVDDPALLRPSPTGLLGNHKLRWVVCSQLSMIASGRGTTVGHVIESILPIEEANDWILVERLDRIIDRESIPWERPAGSGDGVALSRAWGVKTRNNPTYSLADFCDVFLAESGLASFDDPTLEDALQRFYEAHTKDTAPDHSTPLLKS